MTIKEEVHRATKLLETIMQAGGLTRKDLDQRLEAGPGYVSQLFTGRMELKVRHVLAILRALRVEPGVFFQALYPDGKPVGDRMVTEEFLKRFRRLSLGVGEGGAGADRPVPAAAEGLDYSALHDLVRSAVRAALDEPPPAAQQEASPRGASRQPSG